MTFYADLAGLIGATAGTSPETRAELWRELRRLADELNELKTHEVSLVHVDGRDFLSFAAVDPTEGSYWRELEDEQLEKIIAAELESD